MCLFLAGSGVVRSAGQLAERDQRGSAAAASLSRIRSASAVLEEEGVARLLGQPAAPLRLGAAEGGGALQSGQHARR